MIGRCHFARDGWLSGEAERLGEVGHEKGDRGVGGAREGGDVVAERRRRCGNEGGGVRH